MAGWGVPRNGLDQQPRPRGGAKAAGGHWPPHLTSQPRRSSWVPPALVREAQKPAPADCSCGFHEPTDRLDCDLQFDTPGRAEATFRRSPRARRGAAVQSRRAPARHERQKRPPSRAPLCPSHGDEGTEGRTVADTPSHQLGSETSPGRLPVFTPPHQFTEGKCGALKRPAPRLLTEFARFLKTLSRVSVF